MSNNPSTAIWRNQAKESQFEPAFYSELAEWCEQLDPAEQRLGFDRILNALADFSQPAEKAQMNVAGKWISMLADAGAFESAAIAMIPRSATFTGGRMKDGAFVAQVIPEGSAGAHSRNARSLAMAWLAALLRALARQSAEAKGASTH